MIGGAKTVNQFWSKIIGKKLQSSLNPFAKERRDLNFWQVGVILHGEYVSESQSTPALPKRPNHAKNFASNAKILRTNFTNKFFDVETCNFGNHPKRVLAKFEADRSHPRGVKFKRPFEVLNADRRVLIAVAFECRTSRFNRRHV